MDFLLYLALRRLILRLSARLFVLLGLIVLRLSARLFVLLGLIGGVMSHLDFQYISIVA